jgi:Asp-tRNA(Asn)/Glu-tRNA(Gln) amidotransferase A subunit family amidase
VPPPLVQGDVKAADVAGPILDWVPYNTAPLNISGHPVVAMPSGVDAGGLPTSIQLVARRFQDAEAVRAGRVVERGLREGSAWPQLRRE